MVTMYPMMRGRLLRWRVVETCLVVPGSLKQTQIFSDGARMVRVTEDSITMTWLWGPLPRMQTNNSVRESVFGEPNLQGNHGI